MRALLRISLLCLGLAAWEASSERPNILWITSEDNGPHLGSYGDANADTPHLDALAARGTIYLNARSEEHTSELQSRRNLVCRLLPENKKNTLTADTARRE